MDVPIFSFFLFFLIPVVYLCLHTLKLKNKFGAENVRLPPGTSGLPVIGETLSFYIKIRRGVQFEFISDRMRKYSSKIFRTSLMGEQVAVISSAEGNKFMFSNEGKNVEIWFPSRVESFFPKSDNQPSSVHAKRLRSVLHPWILKNHGLQDCVSVMDSVMRQHVKAYWTSKDETMILKGSQMAKRFTLALGCNLFAGITDLSEIERFVDAIDNIESAFIAIPINIPGTAWHRGVTSAKFMRDRFEGMVIEKMQILKDNNNIPTREKDFMAEMILAKDENGESMTVEDIGSHMVGLLEAGYLTLQTTITMLLRSLAELPHVYDSVLQEQKEIAKSKKPEEGLKMEDFEKMKYSWNVVREVLRLYSPGVGGFREAINDLDYQGYTIPKGWKIYWLSQSTHMNPTYFPDPETFDPSRFDGDLIPYTFVPFGAGLRMCPGYKFAKLVVLTFLHYVVTEFRWEKMNPNEKILYDFVPSSAQGLPIRIHRHKN